MGKFSTTGPRFASNRSTSTALGYTLTLTISTLLVTGLIISGSDFVTSQREVTIEHELEVIGEQIAAQLQQADRVVRASTGPPGSTFVRIKESYPDRVTGKTYDVILNPGSPTQLRIETDRPAVAVTLSLDIESIDPNHQDTAASGGIIVVRCENTPPNGCTDPNLVIANG